MRIVVVAVGRVRAPFADDVAHYAKLLSGHARLEQIEVAEDDRDRPGPAALPAVALSALVLSAGITTISNQLSRRIEARADTYALELTGAPQPFIDFEQRITVRNIAEPDPPGWARFLFGTHPTTLQRIGAAEAFRESARRAGRPIRGGS